MFTPSARTIFRAVVLLLSLPLLPVALARAATLADSAHPADPVDLVDVRESIGEDEDLIDGPATQIGNVFNFTVNTSRLTPKERTNLIGPLTPLLHRPAGPSGDIARDANAVVGAIDDGLPVMVWMQEDGPDVRLMKICFSSGPVLQIAQNETPVSAAVAANAPASVPVAGAELGGMRAPHQKLPADIRRRLLDVREEISALPGKPPFNPGALMSYEARVRNISGTLQTLAIEMKSESRTISTSLPGVKEESVIANIDKGGNLAAMAPVQVTSLRNLDPDVRASSPINPTETLRRAYVSMNDNLSK